MCFCELLEICPFWKVKEIHYLMTRASEYIGLCGKGELRKQIEFRLLIS